MMRSWNTAHEPISKSNSPIMCPFFRVELCSRHKDEVKVIMALGQKTEGYYQHHQNDHYLTNFLQFCDNRYF